MNYLTQFWDWVDNRAVIRRLVLLSVLALVTYTGWWCTEFAMTQTARSGADIAMIISSVMAFPTTLLGFVSNFYNASRQNPVVNQQ